MPGLESRPIEAHGVPGTASNSAAENAASNQLSTEANSIGMTGAVGTAERLALTTIDGVAHTPEGFGNAVVHDITHPLDALKTVGESAAIAAGLKVVLPEAGPVGRIAAAAMGVVFVGSSLHSFGQAYETGLNAKTWNEFDESGKQWGNTLGNIGVEAILGTAGYKLGAGLSGHVLSSESMDSFADWKQGKWDAVAAAAKEFVQGKVPVPAFVMANSYRMQPNIATAPVEATPAAPPSSLDTTVTAAASEHSSPTEATSTTAKSGSPSEASSVSVGNSTATTESGNVAPDRVLLLDTADSVGANAVPAKPDARISATIMLQGKATTLRMDRTLARMAAKREAYLTDENDAFEKKFGVNRATFDKVKAFLDQNHIDIDEADMRSGRVAVTGDIKNMNAAFGTELQEYKSQNSGLDLVGYQGTLSVPKDLDGSIRAILMGDTEHPLATNNYRVQRVSQDGQLQDTPTPTNPEESFLKTGGYLATEIAKAQNFPLSTGGEGQHGAFISFDGGINLEDYNKFFPEHGLEQPKPLKVIEVNGAKNIASGKAADTENALDGLQIQSIAPRANISFILGENSLRGMTDVYERAIFPREGEAQNSVVSTSWGLAEMKNGPSLKTVLNNTFRHAQLRGVTIFAGAGDNGARSLSNLHQPEYPASDPNVTGVGGLKMRLDDTGALAHVMAWDEGENSSTGGGISSLFKVPYWQAQFNNIMNRDTSRPGRGVPDISTNAAKSTGFPVRVGGQTEVIGGTSAGAPLYAGLMLNLNAELNNQGIDRVANLNPWMYARGNDANIFHVVTEGGNHGYDTRNGWSAVTGLGWVDGTAMLNAMKENQSNVISNNVVALFPIGGNQSDNDSSRRLPQPGDEINKQEAAAQ